MNIWPGHTILLVLMLTAAGVVFALRPTQKVADQAPKIDVEALIPRTFAEWREEQQVGANYQPAAAGRRRYNLQPDTLTHLYQHARLPRLAFDCLRRGSARQQQMHYPEVCYPAQGFQVLLKKDGVFEFDKGFKLPIRQLETSLDKQRDERLHIGKLSVISRQ